MGRTRYRSSEAIVHRMDSIKDFSKRISKQTGHYQPYLLLFFVIAFLLCVIISTVWFSSHFLPEPATDDAKRVVPLFNTTLIFTGIAFFLTQALLFYFAFAFRTKRHRRALHQKTVMKLELTWTIIPAVVFIFLFLWGQIIWTDLMADPGKESLTIDVMGEQFNWWVRYPGEDNKLGRTDFRFIEEKNAMGIDPDDPSSRDDFIPVQMHIPVHRNVTLILRSRDVIHSFFIPHFRTKMDALPGIRTALQFTANTTTAEMRERLNNPNFNYEVGCAELCGRMHFAMKLILVVEEQEEFERWATAQKKWVDVHPENIADH